MADRRVVITGLGIVSSLGNSVGRFWDRLANSESGIDTLASFDTSAFPVHIGGECREFNQDDYLDRREAKRLDRFALLAIGAAQHCLDDSGLDLNSLDPFRIGVIVGSGIGGLREIEEQHIRLLDKGPGKVSAFTVPKLMANAAAGNISMRFNCQGPSTTVATACASASHAMGDALNAIRLGYSDVMFTGGAEAAVTPLGLAAFSAMKALSTRNDDPQAASRPFDRDRDGFVMGEGAGIVMLEDLDHAKRRGAKIYAELVGVGSTSDAGHITQPAEDGHGAVGAMQMALRNAGVDPTEVDHINAHGTATPLGDIAETKAIRQVFGDHAPKIAIASTKGALGHLLGASGGVELIAAVMAIQHRVVPPTINLDNPDPACDLDYVPNQARDMNVRVALSNSFGFGGHNACVCVKAFE